MKELIPTGEPASVAEPFQEIQLDPTIVEVAREADQVGLDLAGLLAERRVGPDVAGDRIGSSAAVHEGPGGVDAVGRDEGVDGDEVGGGESQAGAPARPASHDAP